MKKLLYLFLAITITFGCESHLDYEKNAKNIEISKYGRLLFKNVPYEGRLISNTSNEDGIFKFDGNLYNGSPRRVFDTESHLFSQEFIDYVGMISLKLNPDVQDSIKVVFDYAVGSDTFSSGTIDLPSGSINFEAYYDPSPYKFKFEKIINDGVVKFQVIKERKSDLELFNDNYINESDCHKVARAYLNTLGLSNILWLHEEGYSGGICSGAPNQYCGRVQKFQNGEYWTYDIIVWVEPNGSGGCKVTGIFDNLPYAD